MGISKIQEVKSMPKGILENVLLKIPLQRIFPIMQFENQKLFINIENRAYSGISKQFLTRLINDQVPVSVSIAPYYSWRGLDTERKDINSAILTLEEKKRVELEKYLIIKDIDESILKFYDTIYTDPEYCLIDFTSWQIISRDVNVSELSSPFTYLIIERIDFQKRASKLRIIFDEYPKYKNFAKELTYCDISHKIPYIITDSQKKYPIEIPEIEIVPGIGVRKLESFNEASINTFIDLMKEKLLDLKKLRYIGEKTIKNLLFNINRMAKYKVPLKYCEILDKFPKDAKICTPSTKIVIYVPKFMQLFVGGLPFYTSGILENLLKIFSDYEEDLDFTSFLPLRKGFQANFKNNKYLKVYGPWIVEFINFGEKDRKILLNYVLEAIKREQESRNLSEICDILIPLQEEKVTPDQFLKELLEFQKLNPTELNEFVDLIYEEITELVVDTSIIVDNRLSYLLAKELLDEEIRIDVKIIIPNIVMYEIKAWGDKPTDKKLGQKYKWANNELEKLSFLHQAGYISLVFKGDLPPFPHTIKPEGGYMFAGALRDENILHLADTLSETTYLITSDNRQAKSASIRGLKLILLQSLTDILRNLKIQIEGEGINFEDYIKDEINLEILSSKYLISKDFLKEKINFDFNIS